GSLPVAFTGAPAPGASAGSSKTQASSPWEPDGPQPPTGPRLVSPMPIRPRRSGARTCPWAAKGLGAGGGIDGAGPAGGGEAGAVVCAGGVVAAVPTVVA